MGKGKELVKNTAIITIGKVCTQFLSFFLLPLYTSILSAAEYGTADLLMIYQQLIVCVAFAQVEQALFRYLIEVRGNSVESGKIITSCFGFALIQAIVLGIVMAIVSIFSDYPYMIQLYLYIVAVIFSNLMLQSARGLGDNVAYALGSFISAISIIVFNILFLAVWHKGVQGMMVSYILGNSLCGVFIFVRLKVFKLIKPRRFDAGVMKECLHYSLPLVPNALSWWVISGSDRMIVAGVLGTAYSGFLAVAHKFPSAYGTMYTIFNLSWTESASLHIHDKDAENFFSETINRIYRLFASMAVGIIACIPFIFSLLINEGYDDAYYLIPIYMIASLCQVFQGMYSVVYVALKKTKEVAKSVVVSAIINIVVHLLLIRYVGVYAAPISTLVAYLFLCIWRYFDLKKYLDIPFDKKLLCSTIVIMAAVCVGYYLGNLAGNVICLLLAVIYACVLNKGNIVLLKRMIKR